MRKKTFIAIFLILILTISCQLQLPNKKTEIEQKPDYSKYSELPELFFSNIFIDDNDRELKFFSITNNSDNSIELADYGFCQKKSNSYIHISYLPDITLEPSATLYCINEPLSGWLPIQYKKLNSLPQIIEGSISSGSEALYIYAEILDTECTYEITKNIYQVPRTNTYVWDTVDIISFEGKWPTIPTSAVRVYDASTSKDYGWRMLDPHDATHIKILDGNHDLKGGSYSSPSTPTDSNIPGGNSDYADIRRPTKEELKKRNIELGIPLQTSRQKLTTDQDWEISRESYWLSFNHDRNIPNWVCWHLDSSDIGRIKRPKDAFKADRTKINPEYAAVEFYDYHYTKYGFDRGHMCPNGDRNGNRRNQLDTFYMTNMVPQAGNNNQGPWAALESYIRYHYVRNDMEVYIVSGPSLENGGTTVEKNGEYAHPGGTWEKITNTRNGKPFTIDVPAYTWKVLIAIPEGDNDIARINENPDIAEVYAVWMPNSDKDCPKESNFGNYLVSIDFVEEMTGFDFFPELDDAVESILESIHCKLDPEIIIPASFRYEYDEPQYDNVA